MADSTKVVRYGRNEMTQHEANADVADGEDILVGSLLERTANGVTPHGSDGAAPDEMLVAIDDRDRGMELGYRYPSGDNVKMKSLSGGGLNLPIAAGVSVTNNTRLVSAGDGTYRPIDQDGTSPDDPDAAAVAVTEEAIDNTGASEPAYVASKVLN